MVRQFHRGRPRKQQEKDLGTLELQQKRQHLAKNIPGITSLAPSHCNAYFSGSHLHGFYLLGTITENQLNAALTYAKIKALAYKSMGLRISVKSALLPKHLRSSKGDYQNARMEKLWKDLNTQLQTVCSSLEYQVIEQTITAGPAPYPCQKAVRRAFEKLEEITVLRSY